MLIPPCHHLRFIFELCDLTSSSLTGDCASTSRPHNSGNHPSPRSIGYQIVECDLRCEVLTQIEPLFLPAFKSTNASWSLWVQSSSFGLLWCFFSSAESSSQPRVNHSPLLTASEIMPVISFDTLLLGPSCLVRIACHLIDIMPGRYASSSVVSYNPPLPSESIA